MIVIAFEIQLKETFDRNLKSPSKERVDVCMSILDEITPLLGNLTPVIRYESAHQKCCQG